MDGYLLLAETLCREGIKDHIAFVVKGSIYGRRVEDDWDDCDNEIYGHLQFCRCPWFDTYSQISTQKHKQLMNYCNILGGIE